MYSQVLRINRNGVFQALPRRKSGREIVSTLLKSRRSLQEAIDYSLFEAFRYSSWSGTVWKRKTILSFLLRNINRFKAFPSCGEVICHFNVNEIAWLPFKLNLFDRTSVKYYLFLRIYQKKIHFFGEFLFCLLLVWVKGFQKKNVYDSPHVREFRFRNPRNFC